MHITRTKTLAAIATAAIAVPIGAAVVNADVFHEGPPGQFGPPLEEICDNNDVAAAAAAGYNVIVLNNLPNVFSGTAAADAIFALGGADQIQGGPGDDLICLGYGNDRAQGGRGNDAVFGEEGEEDRIFGGLGNDWLDGGPGGDDRCFGGPQFDDGVECEPFTQ